MTTKNYICILVGAAFLVSCAEVKKNEAPTTTTTTSLHGPIPSPSPVPAPGKRTETGTVIGVTVSQITLRVPSISAGHAGAGTQGTFRINRTASTKVTGTLTVGSTVTVESNETDWHQVST